MKNIFLIIKKIFSVTSKQFWDQVEEHNIKQLEAAYAYKHDFEMFGYSVQEYLSNMNVSVRIT